MASSPADPAAQAVLKSDQLEPGAMREVVVEGVRVLVARLRSGEVCAASPSCPHEGAPLAQGTVRQAAVDCPRHHYLFDLKTGENLYPVPIYPEWKKQQVGDLDLRTFPAYESDGWIWVIRRSGDTRAEG